MKKRVGAVLVILAAVFWGLIGIFVRDLNVAGFKSIQIVAIRALGATILLALFFFIKDRTVFKIKIKDIWVFWGTGLGSMVFFNFCYFGSIERTSLAIAAALLYTAPAFVAILSGIFLKEHISKMGIIAIILAILGCMLTAGIFTTSSRIDFAGLLLGIGSGLGYALYSIFGKIAIRKGYKSFTITFYTFLIATLCTWFVLLKEENRISLFHNDISSLRLIISLLGLIILSTIMAYICYTTGLSKISANTAAVLASIEPVVAAVISVLIFKEAITISVLMGIICILTSTIVIVFNKA